MSAAAVARISRALPAGKQVKISLYASNGMKVGTVFDGIVPMGAIEIPINRSGVAQGTYLCEIAGKDFRSIGRCVVAGKR
jgi:hypothetical protein